MLDQVVAQGGVDDESWDADGVAEVQPCHPNWSKHAGDLNVDADADVDANISADPNVGADVESDSDAKNIKCTYIYAVATRCCWC